MEIIDGNIYDYPKYYDLIFGSDWRAEVRFLTACFEKHASGEVRRLFEPACGTGRLIHRLGLEGFDVRGLDINPRAVAYCNARLARAGLKDGVFVGDMTDFSLRPKADAAFNTINSFRHLSSEKQARDHLRCMAGALRKGGIYALGFHLTPTVGQATEEEGWTARRGHLQVNTYMWLQERNLSRREEWYGMQFDIYTPTKSSRINDRILFRTYTVKQFQRLVSSVEEFAIDAIYDFSYDIDGPVEWKDDTEDVVVILKKR